MGAHSLNYIEVASQLFPMAGIPITLVAHQQQIWSQLAKTWDLHERLRSSLKWGILTHREESFGLVLFKPVDGLGPEMIVDSLTVVALLNRFCYLNVFANEIKLKWSYQQNVATDEQRNLFGDEICKVDQWRSRAWHSSQHQQLWAIVFNVFFDTVQLLHALEGRVEGLRLGGWAPVCVCMGQSINDDVLATCWLDAYLVFCRTHTGTE
jgi:hypothetical protein